MLTAVRRCIFTVVVNSYLIVRFFVEGDAYDVFYVFNGLLAISIGILLLWGLEISRLLKPSKTILIERPTTNSHEDTRNSSSVKLHQLPRKVWMRGHLNNRRLRGFLLSAWIRAWGGKVGRNLLVDRGVHLRHPPSTNWAIGDNVYIGRGTILDVWPTGVLELGSRVKVMHYVTIASRVRIAIADGCQIADTSMIRDHGHGTQLGEDMLTSEIQSAPVHIDEGAWVGRGCSILPGAHIQRGAVIGANSVVTSTSDVSENTIVAGSPVRTLRKRV